MVLVVSGRQRLQTLLDEGKAARPRSGVSMTRARANEEMDNRRGAASSEGYVTAERCVEGEQYGEAVFVIAVSAK